MICHQLSTLFRKGGSCTSTPEMEKQPLVSISDAGAPLDGYLHCIAYLVPLNWLNASTDRDVLQGHQFLRTTHKQGFKTESGPLCVSVLLHCFKEPLGNTICKPLSMHSTLSSAHCLVLPCIVEMFPLEWLIVKQNTRSCSLKQSTIPERVLHSRLGNYFRTVFENTLVRSWGC